jgi:hypothetical protein
MTNVIDVSFGHDTFVHLMDCRAGARQGCSCWLSAVRDLMNGAARTIGCAAGSQLISWIVVEGETDQVLGGGVTLGNFLRGARYLSKEHTRVVLNKTTFRGHLETGTKTSPLFVVPDPARARLLHWCETSSDVRAATDLSPEEAQLVDQVAELLARAHDPRAAGGGLLPILDAAAPLCDPALHHQAPRAAPVLGPEHRGPGGGPCQRQSWHSCLVVFSSRCCSPKLNSSGN